MVQWHISSVVPTRWRWSSDTSALLCPLDGDSPATHQLNQVNHWTQILLYDGSRLSTWNIMSLTWTNITNYHESFCVDDIYAAFVICDNSFQTKKKENQKGYHNCSVNDSQKSVQDSALELFAHGGSILWHFSSSQPIHNVSLVYVSHEVPSIVNIKTMVFWDVTKW